MEWADCLYLALGDVDAQLRREMPAVFERVDAIKARPGRKPQSPPNQRIYNVTDCAWCGDDFPTYGERRECCSRPCAVRYRAWKRRRQRLTSTGGGV